MADALRPRWGQPITGIVAFITFLVIALGIWFVFSDPRGPVGAFPYPFVMYLAMMILVGLWQHMLFGDWPFAGMAQPARGVALTIANLVIVWFTIHVVFYNLLGLGFNFLSQDNLNALAASGQAMLADGRGGSIVNIASLSGITALSRVFTYSATKAAVINLTQNLAREWAASGIRVNALSPGFFPAEQNRKVLTPDRVASIMTHTPIDRFGESHELAGAILLLSSPTAGSFLTGENLVVDGGFMATTI